MDSIRKRGLERELIFRASRSSGPGGQNVNKVSSKVELRFRIAGSLLLSQEEKDLMLTNLSPRINQEGELVLVSQSERSQPANRDKVLERFFQLVEKSLRPKKKRKKTVIPVAEKERRLEEKKLRAETKENRKRPSP